MGAITADEVVVRLRAENAQYDAAMKTSEKIGTQAMDRIERAAKLRTAIAPPALAGSLAGISPAAASAASGLSTLNTSLTATSVASQAVGVNAGVAARAVGSIGGVALGGIVAAAAAVVGLALAFKKIAEGADEFKKQQNALRVTGLSGEALTATTQKLTDIAIKEGVAVGALVPLYGKLTQAKRELKTTDEQNLRVTQLVAQAIRISGQSATELRGPLLQLNQLFATGVVRAEEYNSVQEGMPVITRAVAAGLAEAGGSVAKLTTLVKDGKVSSEAFFAALNAGAPILAQMSGQAVPLVEQAQTRLKDAVTQTTGALDEATGASRLYIGILDRISSVVRSIGEAATGAKKALSDLPGSVSSFGDRALEAAISARDALGRIPGISGGEKPGDALRELLAQRRAAATEAERARLASATYGGMGPDQPPVIPVRLADYPPPKKETKGRRTNYYEDEIRQIKERTRAQQDELAVVGQSEAMKDRARALTELENAARRQGIALTDEQRTKMLGLADAYAVAAQRTREAEASQRAFQELFNTFGNIAVDSIQGLVDGTKSLNDVLQETLRTLAKMLLQAAILGQGPLANIGGNTPQNSLSGLFMAAVNGGAGAAGGGTAGAGGWVTTVSGVRANGGPVGAGRAYMVGERGPEMFLPGQAGSIVPRHSLAGGSASGAAAPVTINADLRDSSAPSISVLTTRLDRLERNLPMLVQQATKQGRANQPFYGG